MRRLSVAVIALADSPEPVNENETFEQMVYEGIRTIAV